MKIVICGSMRLSQKMLKIKEELTKLGHFVIVPRHTEEYAVLNTSDHMHNESVKNKINHDLIRQYFNEIERNDAVLVVNDSLKEINSAYRQLDEDQTSALKKYAKAHGKISREEGKIISQLEEREKKMLKHGQSLEEKIEKIVPVFLLTAASASFGYSLLNTLSRDISNITGSIIGINPSNGPSLLLSTLALIIIIFIVSPSGSFKELLKKK